MRDYGKFLIASIAALAVTATLALLANFASNNVRSSVSLLTGVPDPFPDPDPFP
jgi:hypothetical protein